MYSIILSVNGTLSSFKLEQRAAETAVNNAIETLMIPMQMVTLDGKEDINIIYGDSIIISVLPLRAGA